MMKQNIFNYRNLVAEAYKILSVQRKITQYLSHALITVFRFIYLRNFCIQHTGTNVHYKCYYNVSVLGVANSILDLVIYEY